MTAARDQVSFQLRITYLKDQAALEKATKILAGAKKLAEPFLASYPIASQIMEASLGFIHDTVPLDDKPVSATTWFVDPEHLYRESADQDGMGALRVFFLMPINFGGAKEARGGGFYDVKKELYEKIDGSKPADGRLAHAEDEPVLVECEDMPGRLCVTWSNRNRREQDLKGKWGRVSQARTEIDVSSRDLPPRFPPAGGLNPLLVYVQQYDVETGWEVLVEDLDDKTRQGLDKLLTGYHAEFQRLSEQGETCSDSRGPVEQPACAQLWVSWSNLFDVAVGVVRDVRTLRRQVASIPTQKDTRYRVHRLDSLVYVTISFKPFEHVYDPRVIIPGTVSSCRDVTVDSIDKAQEYFGGNVDFFTETDGEKIRGFLRMAREYVRLLDYVDRGAYGEAMRTLSAADRLRRSGEGSQGAPGAGSSHLRNATDSLARCFDEVEDAFPLRQFRGLLRIPKYFPQSAIQSSAKLRPPEAAERRASSPRRSDSDIKAETCKIDDSALRMDLASVLFSEITAGFGLSRFSPGDALEAGTLVRLQAGLPELAILLEGLRAEYDVQLSQAATLACPASLDDLAGISVSCEACFKKLKEKCASSSKEIDGFKYQRQRCLTAALEGLSAPGAREP